jgi:hypothetical protein
MDRGAVNEWLPPDVEPMTDLFEADWVVARLVPWDREAVRVESFMPAVFESYARIDHSDDPVHGWSMPPDILVELASLLSGSKTSEPGWFCLWEGWGTWASGAHSILRSVPGPHMSRKQRKELRETIRQEQRLDAERDAELRRIPRVRGEHRGYFLVRGPLSAAVPLWEAAGHEPPNLWWPDDRSWLVSTEIYANVTYVGGSNRLIGALLGSAVLHAAEASVSDHLHPGSSAPGSPLTDGTVPPR